ncbi:MAG: magnesium transporter [Xenococcaceae cyanobacterium]
MTENRHLSVSNQLISRKELRQLVRSQLKILLEGGNLEAAKAVLVPVQPADIADAIEGLPEAMQAIAFRLLSKNEAIEIYEYLDSRVQQALIEDFKRQDVLDIVDKMSPDDRARLFDELPAKVVRRLLAQLSHEEREATALLLGYTPNTAGRIMTPEYISLKEGWTVSQAFECTRRLAPTSETIYSLYVTDAVHHLTGHLSLRNLVTAQPEQTIGEIMNHHVICVHTDTNQEEVARLLQRYDFLAVPVVDGEQRLVGIVTVDDVIDILHEETTKDIHTLGGIQFQENNYFRATLQSVVRRRAFWLIVILLTNSLTGMIIKAQEEVLKQVIILLAFIPLVIDIGGSVGNQSSTVVIRGLNTEAIRSHGVLWVIVREAIAGALLGLILGLVAIVWSYIFQGNLLIALVVGISLLLISLLSTMIGAALPFLFSLLGLDPALMSAPFITTAVDVLGVWVYFYLAKLILQL